MYTREASGSPMSDCPSARMMAGKRDIVRRQGPAEGKSACIPSVSCRVRGPRELGETHIHNVSYPFRGKVYDWSASTFRTTIRQEVRDPITCLAIHRSVSCLGCLMTQSELWQPRLAIYQPMICHQLEEWRYITACFPRNAPPGVWAGRTYVSVVVASS